MTKEELIKQEIRNKDALEFCKKQSMLEQMVGNEQWKHYHYAVNALEKQILKDPIPRDLWELGTATGSSCPNCGYDFPIGYLHNYCWECGQAVKLKAVIE